jgi:hypothetical protein
MSSQQAAPRQQRARGAARHLQQSRASREQRAGWCV